MTAASDATDTAITDARALLQTLLASDWLETHVRSGSTEIFIARDGGGPNPMREAAAAPTAALSAMPPVSSARGADTTVVAPHVATLVDTVAVGTFVAAGETVANLRVLDETIAVVAPVAGTVSGIGSGLGDLLDFKAVILSIAQSA